MLEVKNHALNIGLFKHAEEDERVIVFISGFPSSHDIYTWQKGKVSQETREFFDKLARELGITIALSEN